MVRTGQLLTTPEGILPGQYAMVGSLIPPSKVVCFPHKNGPLLPPTEQKGNKCLSAISGTGRGQKELLFLPKSFLASRQRLAPSCPLQMSSTCHRRRGHYCHLGRIGTDHINISYLVFHVSLVNIFYYM